LYGSGFPKSTNVSKQIDKKLGAKRKIVGKRKHPTLKDPSKIEARASATHGSNFWLREWDVTEAATEEAKQWEGWGTALKPGQEPIVLARKPFDGSMSMNVLKYGTGALNIDESRIGFSKKDDVRTSKSYEHKSKYGFKPDKNKNYNSDGSSTSLYKPEGRWPANVILTHDYRCKQIGTKQVGQGPLGGYNYTGKKRYQAQTLVPDNKPNSASNRGAEIVENWQCHEDCPIRRLDEQSGERKGWAGQNHKKFNPYGGNSLNKSSTNRDGYHHGFGDSGGASRFFYCAKVSRKERNAGLEKLKEVKIENKASNPVGLKSGINNSSKNKKRNPQLVTKNNHPTVKPIALMEYLIRLITPKNGIVLDPFTGSGTTGVAAYNVKCKFIGIEKELEYAKIALKRIHHANSVLHKKKNVGLFGDS
jgi:site-specific DNA-methyltransferase (adenine-specific)